MFKSGPLFGLITAIVLTGCTSEPDTAQPQPQDSQLNDAIQEPLDRARAVEKEMEEAAKRRLEEIEENGG